MGAIDAVAELAGAVARRIGDGPTAVLAVALLSRAQKKGRKRK